MVYKEIVIIGAFGVVGRALIRNLIANGFNKEKIKPIRRGDTLTQSVIPQKSIIVNCSTASRKDLVELLAPIDSQHTFYHISSTAAALNTNYGAICRDREQAVINALPNAIIKRLGVICDFKYPNSVNSPAFIGYWEFLNESKIRLVIDIGYGITDLNDIEIFEGCEKMAPSFSILNFSKVVPNFILARFPYRRINKFLNFFQIAVIG
jgi:hypothetical protein